MPNLVIVDTNIWQFALVKPREQEFSQTHELARSFLSILFDDDSVRVAASSYQVAEICEVLRKSGVDGGSRRQILQDFGNPKFYVKDLSSSDVAMAVSDSSNSGIHVYDYLVAYPFKNVVSKIYSADQHFMHSDFRAIAEVLNPLEPWTITEGRKPEKKKNSLER